MCLALALIAGALFSNGSLAAELSQKETDAARDAAWAPMGSILRKKGRGAIPELAAFLTTNPCAALCYAPALRWAYRLDGWDIFTTGDADMLGMVRKTLNNILEHDAILETSASAFGLVYLAQKGDASDLPLMYRYMADPSVRSNEYTRTVSVGMPLRILQTRVTGTNIVSGVFDAKLYPSFFSGNGYTYTTNSLSFLPSVANTGPQATYVYQVFVRAIFKESRPVNEDFLNHLVNYVPPEMLTMRVWFDKEGKAVTDVDISKYGVTVPGLGFATNAPPNVRELKPVTEIAKATKPPQAGSPRSWAFLTVGFLLSAAAILSIYFKRRK